MRAFREAWGRLVDRHPILRTCFAWSGLDAPLQIVRTHVDLPWEEVDLRALDPEACSARVDEWLDADRRRGFDFGARAADATGCDAGNRA